MSKEILARIDQRLAVLKLAESTACVMAGLSDSTIRNLRRAVKAGEDRGISSHSLIKLAPILETTAAWLIEGDPSPINPLGRYVGKAFDMMPRESKDEFEAEIREKVRERSSRLGLPTE